METPTNIRPDYLRADSPPVQPRSLGSANGARTYPCRGLQRMTEPAVSVAAPAGNTWWAVIRDAIRGVPHDYTAGSLNRAIVLLAIPMVLEMAMESIFAVVDAFWVSHLGPDAVATVGLTESMLTLVYTAAMGLSIGVAAVVARRIGEKRPAAAAEAAVQGIAIGLVPAALVAALDLTLAPRLLSLM